MHRILIPVAIIAALGGAVSLLAQDPPAYMLAKLTIADQDVYAEYRAGFGAVFAQHGGEIMAVSSDPTVLEGEWEATTTVLIRFGSRAEALAWYHSDGYQELVRIRQSASTADFILIDGRL
jgi:uncharacterized protein (DUF1330 family)